MTFNVEYITWVDSQGDGSWQTLVDARSGEVSRVVTIGFVINETDEALALAQSIDGKGTNEKRMTMVDNTITIPKVAITSRSVVEGVTYADE